jgi:HTH-type transcriptional regulator/antitoxin HipB
LLFAQFLHNITDREYMKRLTTESVGDLVKKTRKSLNLTQKDLALTSGTGLRFIIELEQGKPTCQFGKALTVLQILGIRVDLKPPASLTSEGDKL